MLKSSYRQNILILDITFKGISIQIFYLRKKEKNNCVTKLTYAEQFDFWYYTHENFEDLENIKNY